MFHLTDKTKWFVNLPKPNYCQICEPDRKDGIPGMCEEHREEAFKNFIGLNNKLELKMSSAINIKRKTHG